MQAAKCFHRFVGAVFTGLLVWTCDVADQGRTNQLNLKLDDSLTVEAGRYDSILVDIMFSDSTPFKERLFFGAYHRNAEGELKDLSLGKDAPEHYSIIITAYRRNQVALKFRIPVTPEGTLPPEVIFRKPDSVLVKPKPAKVSIFTSGPVTLVADGPAVRLQGEVRPSDADQGLLWSSRDAGVATVDSLGNVKPGSKAAETKVTATSRADASLSASIDVKVAPPAVKVEGIIIRPKGLSLYLGGAGGQVNADVLPGGGTVAYASSDAGVAQVDADGRVTARAAGRALVLANPVGYPLLADTCKVTVEADVPSLNVGGDRQAKAGEELTFAVSVTQKYGSVAMLKWDLDGDGAWDADSLRDSVAAPKHRYLEGGREVQIAFYVRDGEGNEATVKRRVIVGKDAPLVDITRPAGRDTLVRIAEFEILYTLDGAQKSKVVTLKEGANPLVITEGNDGGTGKDSVNVMLDTQAPVVKITSPKGGALTNASRIDVAWTVDGAVQSTSNTESLGGKQGALRIVRDAVDAAGNRGADSLDIVRDTVAPPAPVFTSATTASPTNHTQPQWEWTGSAEGNGTFRHILDGGAETETQAKRFSPASPLDDGPHVFSVREWDAAGNPSAPATRAITISTAGPPAPMVKGSPGPSKSPRWAWKGTGREGAKFRVRLFRSGQATALDSVEMTDTVYIPAPARIAGSDGAVWELRVREQDALTNWGDDGTAFIRVDVVPPAAPVLSGAVFSSASPVWTWPAAAGLRYKYRLMRVGLAAAIVDDSTRAGNFPPAGTTPPPVIEAVYTLIVTAVDSADNAGPEARRSTKVDLSDPVLAITGPGLQARITSVNPTLVGTVSDNIGLKSVTYAVQGGASGLINVVGGAWSLPGASAAYPEGTHEVTVTAVDSADRKSEAKISVSKLPNTVFVRKNAAGNGSGTSWADAFTGLGAVLDSGRTWPDGTRIWVAEGDYFPSADSATHRVFSGKSLALYGGFSDDGTGTSVEAGRNFPANPTELMNGLVISGAIDRFVLDGFKIRRFRPVYVDMAGTVEFRNCTISDFSSAGIDIYGGQVKIVNSLITNGSDLEYAAVNVQFGAAHLEMINTTVTNNTAREDYLGGSGLVLYESSASIQGCIFKGNKVNAHDEMGDPVLVPRQMKFFGAAASVLNIGGTTIEGGWSGIGDTGVGVLIDDGGNKDENLVPLPPR